MVQKADMNRLFLQAMLSRGTVPEKLARTIWKKCIQAVNAVNKDNPIRIRREAEDNEWKQFLEITNASLDKLELGFVSMRDQRTGQAAYSIVNMKGDAIAQMATEYTPAEIAYFKAIVEQIMIAPRHKYSVSSLVAMREVSMIKPKSNITKSQAEVVLSTFVARGWLVRSSGGRYSLSARSLLELKPYLQSNYADQILQCSLCEEMMTTGIACPHEGCNCLLHDCCFASYLRIRAKGPFQCRNCQQEWPRSIDSEDFIPIGERAVIKGEKEQRVSFGGASDEEADDEDNGDVDVDVDTGPQSQSQPTQTQTRKPSKSKGKKKMAAVDEGTDEDTPSTLSAPRPRRNTRR